MATATATATATAPRTGRGYPFVTQYNAAADPASRTRGVGRAASVSCDRSDASGLRQPTLESCRQALRQPSAPNRRCAADFTYVRSRVGLVYVSFMIDCYSRAIVDQRAATTKTTPLVNTALQRGVWRRDRAATRSRTGSSTAATSALKAHSRRCRSERPSRWWTSLHRSVRSATRTTTPWSSRRSGCSGTRASVADAPLTIRTASEHRRHRMDHRRLGRLVERTTAALHPRRFPARRVRAVYYADPETRAHPVLESP